MEKVSVIIPIYNVEQYLERCVESVRKQSYQNLEIILVDDGSPDQCSQICEDYKKKDRRIKVVHKNNGGLSSARNKGIEVAEGSYVCFVDSDDWIENRHVEDMMSLIYKDKYAWIVTGLSIDFVYDRISNKIRSQVPMKECRTSEGLGYLLQDELFNSSCNKLYSRKLIQNSGLKFEVGSEPMEDFIFNCQYARNVQTIIQNSATSYHYMRQDGVSMTNVYIPDLYDKSKRGNILLDQLYRQCDSSDEGVLKAYRKTYIYRIFSCVPNLYRKNYKEPIKKRIQVYRDMKSDYNLRNYMVSSNIDDIYIKSFAYLLLHCPAFLMDLIYNELFFVRNRITWLYKLFRKSKRKENAIRE